MSMQNNESGQVLLIVILGMVVTVVFVLAIASKSIVTIKDTQQQKASEQAFSAAEAGVENALKQNTTSNTYTGIVGNINYTASVSTSQSQQVILNNGQPLTKDKGFDLWLSSYSSDPTQNYSSGISSPSFDVYWGATSGHACTATDGSTTGVAAIEVLVFSANTSISPGSAVPPYSNIQPIQKFVIDPCNSAPNRAASNNFSTSFSAGSSGAASFASSYAYKATINASNVGLIARIVPLYADAPVGIYFNNGGPNFPAQGKQITSTGYIGSSQNNSIQRKLSVFQGFPQVPSEFFQYMLLVPQ